MCQTYSIRCNNHYTATVKCGLFSIRYLQHCCALCAAVLGRAAGARGAQR